MSQRQPWRKRKQKIRRSNGSPSEYSSPQVPALQLAASTSPERSPSPHDWSLGEDGSVQHPHLWNYRGSDWPGKEYHVRVSEDQHARWEAENEGVNEAMRNMTRKELKGFNRRGSLMSLHGRDPFYPRQSVHASKSALELYHQRFERNNSWFKSEATCMYDTQEVALTPAEKKAKKIAAKEEKKRRAKLGDKAPPLLKVYSPEEISRGSDSFVVHQKWKKVNGVRTPGSSRHGTPLANDDDIHVAGGDEVSPMRQLRGSLLPYLQPPSHAYTCDSYLYFLGRGMPKRIPHTHKPESWARSNQMPTNF